MYANYTSALHPLQTGKISLQIVGLTGDEVWTVHEVNWVLEESTKVVVPLCLGFFSKEQTMSSSNGLDDKVSTAIYSDTRILGQGQATRSAIDGYNENNEVNEYCERMTIDTSYRLNSTDSNGGTVVDYVCDDAASTDELAVSHALVMKLIVIKSGGKTIPEHPTKRTQGLLYFRLPVVLTEDPDRRMRNEHDVPPPYER